MSSATIQREPPRLDIIIRYGCGQWEYLPESQVHGANMGPTWVLSAQVGPMLAPWTLPSGLSNVSCVSSRHPRPRAQWEVWQVPIMWLIDMAWDKANFHRSANTAGFLLQRLLTTKYSTIMHIQNQTLNNLIKVYAYWQICSLLHIFTNSDCLNRVMKNFLCLYRHLYTYAQSKFNIYMHSWVE